MGGINVARTCDLINAKLEVTYQRNGFLVRLHGGSGIVCTKFEWKDQQTIKSNQIKTIITSNTKTKTQQLYARFVSRLIDTNIGYHFSDYEKRTNLLIPRFLLSFSLLLHNSSCHERQQKAPKTNLWKSRESLVTRHWTLSHHMFVRDKTPLVYTKQ